MKLPFRFTKNIKRRKTLIGIAVAAVLISLIVVVAVLMDASSVSLINTNEKAGSVLGGGRISSGSNTTVRAVAFDGYVFTEWTNRDGSVASRNPIYKMEVPASNITLYANWKLVEWSLELELDSDTNTTEFPSGFTVESDTIFLGVPTRDGYTFLGWYLDEERSKEYAYDYIPQGTAEEIKLYAKWAPSYKITYDLDINVSNDPDNPSTYTELNDVVLENPVWYEVNESGEATGGSYQFEGWYDEGNNLITTIDKSWKRDITLHAKWKDLDHPIYYNVYEKNKRTYVDLGHYPNHVLDDKATLYHLTKAIEDGSVTPDPVTGLYNYQNTLYSKAVASPYQDGTYFSDDSRIKKDTEYFFIVEPIRWRVLSGDPNDPNSLVTLLSEDVLTASAFQTDLQVRSYAGTSVYANNWQYSALRAFLNGDFFNAVFKKGEARFIQTTQVKIDKSVSHYEKFANGKTCNDKIFLLSYKDLSNTNYNWSHWTREDARRVAKATDYAKAMGVYSSLNGGDEHDACHWWLRTPGEDASLASLTTALGAVGTYSIKASYIGVRPAITVKLG